MVYAVIIFKYAGKLFNSYTNRLVAFPGSSPAARLSMYINDPLSCDSVVKLSFAVTCQVAGW